MFWKKHYLKLTELSLDLFQNYSVNMHACEREDADQ